MIFSKATPKRNEAMTAQVYFASLTKHLCHNPTDIDGIGDAEAP
jgi:hypothetical protein